MWDKSYSSLDSAASNGSDPSQTAVARLNRVLDGTLELYYFSLGLDRPSLAGAGVLPIENEKPRTA